MSAMSLFWNEFRLLMRSVFVRVILVLSAGFAALGIQAVESANDMQFHGMGKTSLTLSLGTAQYGAMAAAVLFGTLTLLVISRDRRIRSASILDAAAGDGIVAATRIAALLAVGIVATAGGFLVTLGIHPIVTASAYEPGPYLFTFGLIMLGAIWIAILLAAALELVTSNLDAGFLSFGAIYCIGFSLADYRLRWVHSGVTVFSDFAGIEPMGRLAVYNRLFWLLAASAAVLAGFCLRRRPGMSPGQSLARNSAGGIVPAAMLLVAAATVWVYLHEPYLFAADSAFGRDLPRTHQAWLETVDCDIDLQPAEKRLGAVVRYGFGKEPSAAQVEFITNAGLRINGLKVNGAESSWSAVAGTDRVKVNLPAGERVEVEFRYDGRIRYPVSNSSPGYITGRSIYLLENSHWLFEPLTLPRGPIRATGRVTAPAWMTVVTPGFLESEEERDAVKTWTFVATCPALTLGLFAADYVRQDFEVGATRVEFYFSPRHQAYIQVAGIADQIRDILVYYQEQIGPYPFEAMPLKIVETSVYKPGGHSSLNVVTMAEYLLNRATVSNPETQPRIILRDYKILAHELAHQWWGSGVAVAEAGKWSSEGLAEYVAYRYLASRYPSGITDNISRGWQGPSVQRQDSWYRRDAGALDRMRPQHRDRLLANENRGQAYNGLPPILLAAEKRLGVQTVLDRLAEVFDTFRGKTIGWDDFAAGMGDAIAPEERP